DATSSPLASPAPMQMRAISRTKLFLIDLMQQHIRTKDKVLPKTREDTNAQFKSAEANEKQL
ncbi:hypothetical protein, partial [Salmonella sp. gx-f7]|uniref:hypothetical protein n=1 Tax=Salmonella sp. gx-f7 TaxID=2582606 RepID=UPI001F3DE726